jgi:hypothetical protein
MQQHSNLQSFVEETWLRVELRRRQAWYSYRARQKEGAQADPHELAGSLLCAVLLRTCDVNELCVASLSSSAARAAPRGRARAPAHPPRARDVLYVKRRGTVTVHTILHIAVLLHSEDFSEHGPVVCISTQSSDEADYHTMYCL